ncbi:keratinocyte differentiation factor 1 [Rhinatrema bivittatum]|uniref:keratinocyte differentiation factor 1 n=1 Tax=Rhinatrema bivittatum TaxID=194408 RepID=UPI00112785EF|nr:keratinocyte differentiation factor 1 [Rhinatrema bivittatum]XP_029426997.1 keratinocyte differentiation factor 1 [Rhinatrema bivittatum]XP_029426998.1 keratinocyte differentiation factor 1 [Rhinatrema bivittatum]
MLKKSPGSPQEPCGNHRVYNSLQDGNHKKNCLSNTSDISLEVFGESTPELKTKRKLAAQQAREQRSRKANPKDSNGREPETIAFISGSAEKTSETTTCCPTLSQAWRSYKSVICCIMTCGHGLQRDSDCYLPCGRQTETSTDDDIKSGELNGYPSLSPANISPKEKNGDHKKKSDMGGSFSYPDLKLMGVPVFSYISPSQQHIDTESCYKDPLPKESKRDSVEKPPLSLSHRGSEEYYSFHESDLEFNELSGSMSSGEIDVLIFRKLTELFTVHQIDELAKCTTDTVFLEKTNKISDLISSITQDYNLDEQDAECRLVRGIIRISTRKSRVRPRVAKNSAIHSQESKVSQGIPPDSGNETMIGSIITSQDVLDLDVQISEETTSDVMARNMRPYGAPGLPVGKDDSFQDTETDSSGAPLLKVYC